MTVQLKICGITRAEDLEVCRALGVDAVGINLWSGSKRGIDEATAIDLLRGWAPGGPLRVAVVVDERPERVRELVDRVGFDLVQPHGDAPVERYATLGIPYVWVIRGTPSLASLPIPEPLPAWVLLDAEVSGYGGAGRTTDWTWAAEAVRALAPLPVWLAGGLHPGNAARAIATVRPAGLDVASGAEAEGSRPGFKDRDRIAALVEATRSSGI